MYSAASEHNNQLRSNKSQTDLRVPLMIMNVHYLTYELMMLVFIESIKNNLFKQTCYVDCYQHRVIKIADSALTTLVTRIYKIIFKIVPQ